MPENLTLASLIVEAERFCLAESGYPNAALYGVTDGKAVGTLIEQKFKKHLTDTYTFMAGNSANGIDLPDAHILTDIKVTSVRQPQSSCPFKGARQKIYGLGYNLLLFVYDKLDDPITKTALLQFVSCSFITKHRTADYSTTYRIRQMLADGANEEDLTAYLLDRNLPADEVQLCQLAQELIITPPEQGYLTVSNALQWRLQYGRVVTLTNQWTVSPKLFNRQRMKILNSTVSESLAFFLSDALVNYRTVEVVNDKLRHVTGILDFFTTESDWQQATSELTNISSQVEEHNAIEYGDFQTNESLAARVCDVLAADGCYPTILVEPTCGQGNFILAALRRFPAIRMVFAIEIYKPYLYQCKFNLLAHFIANPTLPKPTIYLVHQSIFDTDFGPVICNADTDELLILGNPPWVTTATLGAMASGNLPIKTNFKQHTGLDAITGKSNFDIAEFITIQLLTQFQDKRGHLALLVKNSVIKNVVYDQAHRPFRVGNLQKRVFDAKREFNVSVDAALLSATLHTEPALTCAESMLIDDGREAVGFGWVHQKFVANESLYHQLASFDGKCRYEWRQGIKHDCSAVMELEETVRGYSSALQADIQIEEELVHALYKSSDLQKPIGDVPRKFIVVTQQRVGADTSYLKGQYPKIYQYLNQYRARFDDRKSSIYRGKPPFSIFGIGDYSFKPYKVAISGLYKVAQFALLLPVGGKPAMLDDTCYFLGFDNLAEAVFTLLLLNHETTRHLLQAITFSDAKRVYTKDVLMRIDLTTLVQSVTFAEVVASCPPALVNTIDEAGWMQYQGQESTHKKQAERQLSLF